MSFKSHVKLLLQNAHSRIGTPYSVRMISIRNFAMSHLPITLKSAYNYYCNQGKLFGNVL